MDIRTIHDPEFKRYGEPVPGDFSEMIAYLKEKTECPSDAVIYVPSDSALEALPVFYALENGCFGGLPIQIGYCNGHNKALNCLEYHRGSEVNVAAEDMVLLLAPLQAVENGKLDTSAVEAFLVKAGEAVLVYETSMHYAPCTAKGGKGFHVAIVLPKGTNTEKPEGQEPLLFARNKWLLAHPEAPEASRGAVVGLTGKNITIE